MKQQKNLNNLKTFNIVLTFWYTCIKKNWKLLNYGGLKKLSFYTFLTQLISKSKEVFLHYYKNYTVVYKKNYNQKLKIMCLSILKNNDSLTKN